MSYSRIVPRVVMIHLAVVFLIVVVPMLAECTWFKKPPLETIEIDLGSLPPAPPPDKPAPDEPKEEDVIPQATPRPTPQATAEPTAVPTATPRPEATPTPRPAPTPTPTPARRYLTPEEIRQRIQNEDPVPAPQPTVSVVRPEDIRSQIGSGLPTVGNPGRMGGGTGQGVNFGGVANTLYKKLFNAWDQPRHLSGASGLSATAEVTVAKDGRVLSRKIVVSSGIPEFDQSVESALSSVTFAEVLPVEYDGASKAFQYEFQLSR